MTDSWIPVYLKEMIVSDNLHYHHNVFPSVTVESDIIYTT